MTHAASAPWRPAGRRAGRRWRGGLALAAAVLLAAGAGTGCANPNFVPPGSLPLTAAEPRSATATAQFLPGRWQVEHVQQPPQATFGANLIQRAAEVADVAGWSEMDFQPLPAGAGVSHPGTVELSSGAHHVRLSYWMEGNVMAIAARAERFLSHEHWQVLAGRKLLLLRSISDGEVILLRRLGPTAAPPRPTPPNRRSRRR